MLDHRNPTTGAPRPSAPGPAVVYGIRLEKSYRILEERIELYNLSADRKDRIKSAHLLMAQKLLQLYARHLRRHQEAMYYAWSPHHHDLPLLKLNNEFASRIFVCSDRTIRNYRKRLEALGFIQGTVFHGTNAPYELEISPEFLYMGVSTSTEQVDLTRHNRKTFPHTGSSYKNKNLQEQVCGKNCESPVMPRNTEVELEPEQQEPGNRNEPNSHTERSSDRNSPPVAPPPPAAAADAAQVQPDDAPPAPPAGPDDAGQPSEDAERPKPEALRAARVLLAAVLPLLYPGKVIPLARKIAAERQAARLFQGVTELNISRVMENYYTRCLMAALYYRRETNGLFIPPPEVFFNPDVELGFRFTKAWPSYPDDFPIQRNRPTPRLRNQAPGNERTGQVSLYEALMAGFRE